MKSTNAFTILVLILAGQMRAGFIFPSSGCLTSQGWKEYDGHCFKFMYDRSTAQGNNITGMRDTCNASGPIRFGTSGITGLAYLADIHSVEENDFVAQEVAGGNRAWLGAYKIGSTFYWIRDNESSNIVVTYFNWKPNEPNDKDGNEDCVEINRGPPGKWNDLPCIRKLPGVCKYNIAAYVESITE